MDINYFSVDVQIITGSKKVKVERPEFMVIYTDSGNLNNPVISHI